MRREEVQMSTDRAMKSGNLQAIDPIWSSVRAEAAEAVENDPLLAAFLYSTILNHDTLESAVIHRIGERLDHKDVGADLIRQTFGAMQRQMQEWSAIMRVDIQAYYDRDPACDRFIM